jgi:uncharacterized protein (DUF433 family)
MASNRGSKRRDRHVVPNSQGGGDVTVPGTPAEDDLIATYIEQNADRPGLDEARLIGFGIPVWAIVGYYFGVGEQPGRVARDYEVPEEAVAAALAYYRRNRVLIDARLAANAAPIA